MKGIAARWRELSEDDKAEWISKAAVDKDRYKRSLARSFNMGAGFGWEVYSISCVAVDGGGVGTNRSAVSIFDGWTGPIKDCSPH